MAARIAEKDAVGKNDSRGAAGPKAAQGVGEKEDVFVSLFDAQRALGAPA
jgi:hypothetical protein